MDKNGVPADEELCMLEQLCYLDESVAQAAGVESYCGIREEDACRSVGEILQGFDRDSLERLRQLGDAETGRACVSGREWADIIEYLQNSELKNFEVRDTMPDAEGVSLAITYVYPGSDDSAVIAFKGTTGGEEWADNIEGLRLADTPAQKAALQYVETQPYAHVTVTGHSKGANKAMYTALLSDKAERCVAFDGQGFSGEFIERYSAEIGERADRIRNYSLDTDFVHVLMYAVPGSSQIYCRGFGVDNVKQHHSPNSFFQTDADGSLRTDEAGMPVIISAEGGCPVPENPSLTMVHQFTSFLLNNASDKDKNEITGFLAAAVPVALSGLDGEEKKRELMRITGENPDAAADILAWLAKYADRYDLDTDDLDSLLDTFGLESMDEMFGFSVPLGSGQKRLHGGLSTLLSFLMKKLTDGRVDMAVLGLLISADGFLLLKGETPLNLALIWQKAEMKYMRAGGGGGRADAAAGMCRIRDFSEGTWQLLDGNIGRVDVLASAAPAGWAAYSSEPWFDRIHAGQAERGLELFSEAVGETDRLARNRIHEIFCAEEEIDTRYAGLLSAGREQLTELGRALSAMAGEG